MVDDALLTTGLVVILAGIALIMLGGVGVVVYQGIERRLDARAGVPAPGEGRPVDASAPEGHSAPSPGSRPESAATPAREHQHV